MLLCLLGVICVCVGRLWARVDYENSWFWKSNLFLYCTCAPCWELGGSDMLKFLGGEKSFPLCRGCNNFVRRRRTILFRDWLLKQLYCGRFCGAEEAVSRLTAQAMEGGMKFEDAMAARLDLMKPSTEDVSRCLSEHPPRSGVVFCCAGRCRVILWNLPAPVL